MPQGRKKQLTSVCFPLLNHLDLSNAGFLALSLMPLKSCDLLVFCLVFIVSISQRIGMREDNLSHLEEKNPCYRISVDISYQLKKDSFYPWFAKRL